MLPFKKLNWAIAFASLRVTCINSICGTVHRFCFFQLFVHYKSRIASSELDNRHYRCNCEYIWTLPTLQSFPHFTSFFLFQGESACARPGPSIPKIVKYSSERAENMSTQLHCANQKPGKCPFICSEHHTKQEQQRLKQVCTWDSFP